MQLKLGDYITSLGVTNYRDKIYRGAQNVAQNIVKKVPGRARHYR